MLNEFDELRKFLRLVYDQGERKAKLYDGIQGTRDFDTVFRFMDVAHTAFLVYLSPARQQTEVSGIEEAIYEEHRKFFMRNPNE